MISKIEQVELAAGGLRQVTTIGESAHANWKTLRFSVRTRARTKTPRSEEKFWRVKKFNRIPQIWPAKAAMLMSPRLRCQAADRCVIIDAERCHRRSHAPFACVHRTRDAIARVPSDDEVLTLRERAG